MQKNRGYILVFSLLILALCMALVAYIVARGTVFVPYVRFFRQGMQAELLALSGVQVAVSQLTEPSANATAHGHGKEEGASAPANDLSRAQDFLKVTLPKLNRWQRFVLSPENDEIEGEIKVCLMSENGKFNLNQLFDFEKLKFNDEGKEVIKGLCARLEKIFSVQNLFASLESFLKKRGYPLDDPTNLIALKEFYVFKNALFYEPSTEKIKDKPPQYGVYLTDLFTVWTGKEKLQQLFFSESLERVLEITKTTWDAKGMAGLLKRFKLELTPPATMKELFKVAYQKEFAALPFDIGPLIETKFEPTIFSVLSYGTYGAVTKRLFAILERMTDNSAPPGNQTTVVVRKLYWL